VPAQRRAARASSKMTERRVFVIIDVTVVGHSLDARPIAAVICIMERGTFSTDQPFGRTQRETCTRRRRRRRL